MTSLVPIPEASEHACGAAEERIRTVELHEISLVQHHDAVTVDDRVQAMGDGQHGAVLEADAHQSLNQLVRLIVNTCRGFV